MAMRTSAPASIDEYIAASPSAVRPILREIRRTIRQAAPGAEELISYRMPAFRLHGILVYFAAFKNHIGLYPPVSGDARLLKAVAPYAGPKGNLRFPLDRPIPYALIKRIMLLRLRQNISRAPARETKGRGAGRTALVRSRRSGQNMRDPLEPGAWTEPLGLSDPSGADARLSNVRRTRGRVSEDRKGRCGVRQESAMNKVVAHFMDGHLVKGTTSDFMPAKDSFHVTDAAAPAGARPVEIQTKDLKAIFFVRDYAGNPQHAGRNEFDPAYPPAGRRIKVVFKDGEVLLGTTQGYQPGRPGFFIVPADVRANTERCYVVSAATQQVSFV